MTGAAKTEAAAGVAAGAGMWKAGRVSAAPGVKDTAATRSVDGVNTDAVALSFGLDAVAGATSPLPVEADAEDDAAAGAAAAPVVAATGAVVLEVERAAGAGVEVRELMVGEQKAPQVIARARCR